MSVEIVIRSLTTDVEIAEAFALAKQLRTHLVAETFVATVRRQQGDGYVLVGGFDAGRLVTLAGMRPAHTLSRGPHLFVDDLVTDETARRRGYGAAMTRWLRRHAATLRLPRVYLDSRDTARGFYEAVGFTFVTAVPCWIDSTDK